MKAYGIGIGTPFLTSELDGYEWLVSRFCRFIAGERSPSPRTYLLGDWLGLRAGLDTADKRKSLQCRKSNAGHPTRSQTLYRLCCPYSPLKADSEIMVEQYGRR
jgi:hypothetical protein